MPALHGCIAGLSIALLAGAAAAEPAPASPSLAADESLSPGLSVAVPLVVGVAIQDSASTGLAWGARGEVGMTWARRAEGWEGRGRGALLYGELVRLDHVPAPGLMAGAGLAYVEYLGGLSISPSLGLHSLPVADDRRQSGLSLGLFVGRRAARISSAFDMPFGVRVDVHTAIDDPGETLVIASVSGDLIALAGAVILGIQIVAVGGA